MAGGTWAKLVDEGKVGSVTIAFEKAIETSLKTHPMRHLTQAEVKRRFDICARIFEKLRSDLKWGLDRIFGVLPTYLDAELDEKDWAGEAQKARTIWAPGDGA